MSATHTAIVLPPLPYARDALEPHMSRETLDYHYGKHHKAYVDKVNQLIEGTEHEDDPLEELVMQSGGTLFNNAAQVWNHNFFWNCLTPSQESPGEKVQAVLKNFGGLESFQTQFAKAAVDTFGSGWAWLVKDKAGAVRIVSTSDANNPLKNGQIALLTCDVWEHAYYIDHRNDRGAYLEDFWPLVNWQFVAENLESA
jgi:Fe-Mn family superoxide dismutase